MQNSPLGLFVKFRNCIVFSNSGFVKTKFDKKFKLKNSGALYECRESEKLEKWVAEQARV